MLAVLAISQVVGIADNAKIYLRAVEREAVVNHLTAQVLINLCIGGVYERASILFTGTRIMYRSHHHHIELIKRESP